MLLCPLTNLILIEKTKGSLGICWTFDRGNIDFGTNAPEVKVRYVLE